MNLKDYFASLVRTAVPAAVGLLVAYLAAHHAGQLVPAGATPYLTAAAGTLYYAIVRAAERKWPKVGWLLGLPVAPVYPTGGTSKPKAVVVPPGTTPV